MVSLFVFILSGVALVALIVAKKVEMKWGKRSILRAVARGDERVRDLYHKGLHFYTDGKHKFLFFMKKQLPLKTRIYTNKAILWIKERSEERFGNIRNSRFIKKQEGISEFFKSISEVEKGVGELHEEIYEEYIEPTLESEPLAYRVAPVSSPEPIEAPKPKRVRKPRVKKIKVVEVVEETVEVVE